MWIEGSNPTDPNAEPYIDWNKQFKEQLKGELTEEVAANSLGRFLMHNLGIMSTVLTGQMLEPYQRIMVKGWMQKNFTLTVAGRSFGKSLVFSHFCYLYCLLNPGHHIIICSATFRSSRQIVERIDTWSRSKRGHLLRATFAKDMEKRQDLIRITFKNGSTISALPLGDPDNLRGNRCNVLGIDEGLLIAQSTINMVLKPFLAGGADATKKQMVRLREKRLMAEGKMLAKDRTIFKADSKMIVLSSASYKWEELYDMYKTYRAIIEGSKDGKGPEAEETETGVSTYLVHQFSYKAGNPDLMDAGVLEEIRKKIIPESTIKREYEAQFIDESGGFFSAKEMKECTIPNGMQPCVEIIGEKNAEYVLGIDPAIGSDPAGDHFAMCLLKIIPSRIEGKKMGLVVHQYACAGVELKYHIAYLYYILQRFNVVYVVCDTTQGENLSFLNICNESEVFKRARFELNPINAEFGKENWEETIRAVKRSYNPDSSVRRIVQEQYFSSNIIKAGNDHLRACFDQRQIAFASKAQSLPNQIQSMVMQDVMNIPQSHPEYFDRELDGNGSTWEFVLYQDAMMDQVKKECALIEVTASPLGHLSFDLPHHMTRNRKDEKRNRKDSYSALWLAMWGLKILLATQEAPPEESDDTFEPVLI